MKITRSNYVYEAMNTLVGQGNWEFDESTDAIVCDLVTVEQYEQEVQRLESNFRDTQYQRDRKVEYIKLNQFELQFDDSQDNGTRWVDAINAIKAKYPKQ
jgi:hypothetical protein